MKFFFKILLFLNFCFLVYPQKYPLPNSKDTSKKSYIPSQTKNLLQSSIAQKRNTVKILVYGQSISAQDWWLDVKKHIQDQYPNANLIMENKAIGGFSSPLLYKTVEMDVSSFYPDLVLLHIYGDHRYYDTVLYTIRSRMAAEIAIQTVHYTGYDNWSDTMSYYLLPALAKKYACDLIDIRNPWKKYLQENHLEPKQLLIDYVHLNEHGNFLMAELIKPYFSPLPENSQNNSSLCKNFEPGKDFIFIGDILNMIITGNKVDLVIDNSKLKGSACAEILVDGIPPSKFQGTYFMSRPYNKTGKSWPWDLPGMIRIHNQSPWTNEEWTCKFYDVKEPYHEFSFEISGSKTGKDGKGSSKTDFISNSRKVMISKGDADEGGDWHLKISFQVNKKNVKSGDIIKWKTYTMSRDKFCCKKAEDISIENFITLFQGIPNATHKLTIIKKGKNDLPVKYMRVYKPFISEN